MAKGRVSKAKANGTRLRRTGASRLPSVLPAAPRGSPQAPTPLPPAHASGSGEPSPSTGSKRPRPDDDEDSEQQSRTRAAPGSPGADPAPGSSTVSAEDEGGGDDDDDPLPMEGKDDLLRGRASFVRMKGKMVGRLAKPADDLFNALKAGFTDGEEDGPHRILYDKIVRVAPSLVVFIEAVADDDGLTLEFLEEVANTLDRGRKDARGDDTNGIKNAVGDWPNIWGSTPFPKQARHLAGYEHPVCGALLCPVSLDWATDAERLRSGEIPVFAEDFPSFLWPKDKYNPQDMSENFLRGELLVLGYKHIHLGPSAALGLNRATRPGNSRLHGITFVTIEGIVYVAFLLRFALSDQSTFSLGGLEPQGKTWCLYEFYNAVIDTVAQLPKEKVDELLLWWNQRIYPETTRASHGRSSAASASVASRMLAQLQASSLA